MRFRKGRGMFYILICDSLLIMLDLHPVLQTAPMGILPLDGGPGHLLLAQDLL